MKNNARYLEKITTSVIIIAIIAALSITWYMGTNWSGKGVNVSLILAFSITFAVPITLFIIIAIHKFHKETHRKALALITIVYIVVLFMMLLWSYVSVEVYHPGPNYPCVGISFNQTVTEDGWSLRVVRIDPERNLCKNRDITCRLYETISEGVLVEEASLVLIKWQRSPGYNISWWDIDGNNYLSLNDIIFISKTGGASGEAEKGYTLWVYMQDAGYGGGSITLE